MADLAGAAPTEPERLDPTVLAAFREALHEDEYVVHMAHAFLDETPGEMAELAAAARRLDLSAVVSIAHLIRGNALTFGAARLAEVCAAIEVSPVRSRSLLPSMRKEFDEVARSLTGYLEGLR